MHDCNRVASKLLLTSHVAFLPWVDGAVGAGNWLEADCFLGRRDTLSCDAVANGTPTLGVNRRRGAKAAVASSQPKNAGMG